MVVIDNVDQMLAEHVAFKLMKTKAESLFNDSWIVAKDVLTDHDFLHSEPLINEVGNEY